MNIIKSIAVFLVFSLSVNISYAYKYTEKDKDMFYNAFLDGYFTEMEKSVAKLNIDQAKKTQFMTQLKQRTNKQDLIKSSWDCIQKYPIQHIVPASVICTADWTQTQSEKNKELFEMLK